MFPDKENQENIVIHSTRTDKLHLRHKSAPSLKSFGRMNQSLKLDLTNLKSQMEHVQLNLDGKKGTQQIIKHKNDEIEKLKGQVEAALAESKQLSAQCMRYEQMLGCADKDQILSEKKDLLEQIEQLKVQNSEYLILYQNCQN